MLNRLLSGDYPRSKVLAAILLVVLSIFGFDFDTVGRRKPGDNIVLVVTASPHREAAFEAAITRQTRAVVVVHLFGLAARLGEILAIARRHNLYVIEDAACAIGTTYDGKPVGGFGDVGCFSFHPRKVITTGEGGMVTTNQATLASRIRSLRNHGATGHLDPGHGTPRAYTMSPFDVLGYNLRLSDIQAAVEAAAGNSARAVTIAAAARVLSEKAGVVVEHPMATGVAERIETLRATIPGGELDALVASGGALTPAAVLAMVGADSA